MLGLTKNKRKILFYLTLDPTRKRLFGKHFCYTLIKVIKILI